VLGTDRAMFYHAGLTVTEKQRVERAFFEADNAILAATCAYGMGVDKPNIRTVIHTYIPDTVEAFLQESGRAGRDRKPAQSVVIVDTDARERCLRRDNGGAVSPVLDAMFGDTCRRRALLTHLGVSDGACSGCDRCSDPNRRPISPAAELMLESIRSSRLPLTRGEWIAVWRGHESEDARRAGHAGLPGYGLFPRWREFDLERAVDALLRAGALTERHRRLSVSRQFCRGRRNSTDLLRPFLPFETEAR
ncbi:MAG: helicase-related protein, partial [Spirochaeta sp.]|nr:helicase-related protein [Spirochaeta sp.]